ncbi:uncharacterized protein [Phaseolus vulgaris]|uniref:uncharacterized protein n=1 Tax=Phaseolus vulgaris TaxID=3885 RepID=UPI0035CC8380
MGYAERRNHSYANSFTTFFLSNFPDSHGKRDMLEVFQKWARVKEVFISRRRNRWGRRFGFVRFFGVRNAASLERDLDSCFVGNMKLYVNIPRYRRDGLGSKGNAFYSDEVKPPGGDAQSYITRKNKEVWREKGGKEAMATNSYNVKSYADAVKRPAQGQWSGPSITTRVQSLPWLTNSMIGHMLDEFNFETMREECLKGGMSMFNTKFLGDDQVLLSPKAEGRMEDLVKSHKEWFYSVFAEIKPWTEHDVVRYKRVWVRCYGLPLHLWSKECLTKVVGEVATVVGLDEATLSWDCLEYARCQVKMLKSCKADLSKEFRINGRLYNVTVVEEAAKSGRVDYCSKCAFHNEGSSISSSSVESFVADSLVSEKFSEDEDGSEARYGWPEKVSREERVGQQRVHQKQWIRNVQNGTKVVRKKVGYFQLEKTCVRREPQRSGLVCLTHKDVSVMRVQLFISRW